MLGFADSRSDATESCHAAKWCGLAPRALGAAQRSARLRKYYRYLQFPLLFPWRIDMTIRNMLYLLTYGRCDDV